MAKYRNRNQPPALLEKVENSIAMPKVAVKDAAVVVVGNGPSALEGTHGGIIDAHDVVVRINAGVPGKGQTKALGERTDVLACAKMSCLHASRRELEKLPSQMWWMKRTKLGWDELVLLSRDLPEWVNRERCWVWTRAYEEGATQYINPGRELTERRLAKPSTGMRLAWFLTQHTTANMVSLVGFDFWATGDSWWKKERPHAAVNSLNPHKGPVELDAIKRLGFRKDSKGWLIWARD